MRITITFIFYLLILEIQAQDTKTVFSENRNYYLETVTYGDFENKTLGRTTVFSSDSIPIYSIGRLFEIHNKRKLILSNNGQTVCYIIDEEGDKSYASQRSLILYKQGEVYKEFLKSNLITCDIEEDDCDFLYWKAVKDISIDSTGKLGLIYKDGFSEFEKFLCDTNVFVKDDHVYVFTNSDTTIILNLNSGEYQKEPFTSFNKPELLDSMLIPSYTFREQGRMGCWKFPKTAKGRNFEKDLAKYLDLKVLGEIGADYSYKYYEYRLSLKCLIDTMGNAEIVDIEAHDSIPVNKIYEYIKNTKFSTNCNFKYTDKTAFNLIGYSFRNKSSRVSQEEKKIDYKRRQDPYRQRLEMDTIDGFYIPKNLGDCMVTLDQLLKPKDIDNIRELDNPSEMSKYHHGLGMYLRNNWGLWGGSRLRQYFLKRGVSHPDNMSGIILRYYFEWVNGDHESWKTWEEQNPIEE